MGRVDLEGESYNREGVRLTSWNVQYFLDWRRKVKKRKKKLKAGNIKNERGEERENKTGMDRFQDWCKAYNA